MTQYIFPKAPVYYIDGIPAYKAGEWPGIKSNKFLNTRFMIRPVTHDLFRNYSENKSNSKKKIINQTYSNEFINKPGKKLVKIIREHKTEHKFTGELIPAIPELKPFIKKKYYFEYVNNYHDEKEEEHNKMLKDNLIMSHENNNLESSSNKKIFTKQFYENISNNKLLGVTFTKESFNALKKKVLPKISNDDYIKNTSSVFRHLEGKKMANIKTQQENRQRDIDYVISLNNWGIKTESLNFKSFNLPKLIKE